MIGAPKRSVTRFFIPLIDVLLLLFCIFLLMPFVEKGAASASRLTPGQVEQLKRQIAFLEKKVADLEKTKESPEKLLERINELEEEVKKSGVEKLAIRTFHIDGKTGVLWYLEETLEGDRIRREVTTSQQAEKLIDGDLEKMVGGNNELVYLILYPQQESGRPYRSDRDRIEAWFSKRVKLKWETGTGNPMGGMKP